MERKFLEFIANKTVIVNEETIPDEIKDDEVAGKTLYTLISAGTEMAAWYINVFNWGFPRKVGYTSVFRIDKIGAKVEGLEIGDVVFSRDYHQSYQVANYLEVVKVPKSIAESNPEHALFARMAEISLSTLNKTNIKPDDKVLVTGLGPVGIMALQAYSALGYEVIGADPDKARLEMLKKLGLTNIFDKVPTDDENYCKKIGLALECSGNESAVLDCCNMVRPFGEVSLVGVPWKPCSNIAAHPILNAVFYNYVKLYSGFEADVQKESSKYHKESMNGYSRLILKLIEDKKMNLDGLYAIRPYSEAQTAYDEIYNKEEKALVTILKWE